MRHLTAEDIHAGRGIRYEALSEHSGILVTEDDIAIIIAHDQATDVVDFMLCEKGDRPTFLNRSAALSMREKWYDAWIGETEAFTMPHPANITTKEKPSSYVYREKGQDVFTAEYQLYLAKELEKKERGHKPTQPEAKILELSGFLPHEVAPE